MNGLRRVGELTLGQTDWRTAFAWLSLAAAVAMFVVAQINTTEATHVALHSISAACGVVGVALFAAIAFDGRRTEQEGVAFDGDFGASVAPTFMSDDRGRFLRGNPAFRAANDLRKGGVTEALDVFANDPGGVAYRVARAAIADGAAEEASDAPDGSGYRVSAIRRGARRLIWRIEPAVERDGVRRAFAAADAAFFRLREDFSVGEGNAAFEKLPREDRDRLSTAGAQAAELKLAEAVATLSNGRQARIALLRSGPVTDCVAFVGADDAEPAAEPAGAALLDDLPVALMRLDREGRILSANAAARALLGDAAREGVDLNDILVGLGRPIDQRVRETAAGRGLTRPELAQSANEDKELFLQVSLTRSSENVDGDGGLIALLNDATELKTLEQQFVQSQKMQAVGQLAGGVAHDFNNLLTAIIGHCDLLSMRRDDTDPDYEDLSQIRQNANRAAALVRQLLAFSRQQKLNPKSCDLPDVLADLSHLLNRLIGERVSLRVDAGEDIWPVWIDAQQFEQVILNLVVNARDAMPEGGEVSIRCENVSLDEELKRDRAVVPLGDYVAIEVADEGDGMSPETAAKVFEPFFTTKKLGEGTGLGLSTAYGIVKQTGGFIFVDSAPGRGAAFRILLPRQSGDAAHARVVEAPPVHLDLTGAGRILLVEDETPVRAFASRALRLRGHEVREAEDAEAALEILEDENLEIDLVISDVVMPGMDGPTWVRRARERRPDLPVIFTSGYAEDMFRNGLSDLGACSFLPKPFSLDDLGAAVKTALSREDAPSS